MAFASIVQHATLNINLFRLHSSPSEFLSLALQRISICEKIHKIARRCISRFCNFEEGRQNWIKIKHFFMQPVMCYIQWLAITSTCKILGKYLCSISIATMKHFKLFAYDIKLFSVDSFQKIIRQTPLWIINTCLNLKNQNNK